MRLKIDENVPTEAQEKTVRSQTDLAELRKRLDGLVPSLGTQRGGYDFQAWFYDLMDFSDIDNRRPFVQSGRQIDGSVTIDGTTYLVELKFTSTQADATDIDSLLAKVNTKADNTMGIMVSMSGYSSVAIQQASFAKSPLLLFDFNHLHMVLGAVEAFADVLRRVRRHSLPDGKCLSCGSRVWWCQVKIDNPGGRQDDPGISSLFDASSKGCQIPTSTGNAR